jgi:hypothetical protein
MCCFPLPKAFETEEMLICYSPKFPLPIVGEGEGDFTGLINEKMITLTVKPFYGTTPEVVV